MALALTQHGFAGFGDSLGTYTQGTKDGPEGYPSCSVNPGANFICRSIGGGETACLPCTFDELAGIRNFQEQINRIIESYSLGEKYRLDVDGRVGQRTTASAAVAFNAVSAIYPIPASLFSSVMAEAAASPTSIETQAKVTQLAVEIATMFKQAADDKGAPEKVKEAKPKTIFKPPPTIEPHIPKPRTASGAALAVGAVALLAAVGLVGTAAYYKRPGPPGRRGKRGQRGKRGKRGRRGYRGSRGRRGRR